MNRAILQEIFFEELAEIAPEVERICVDADSDLRDELDINAADFRLLLIALGERVGVRIPDTDHHLLGSFNNLLAYLVKRLPKEEQPGDTLH